MHNQLYPLNGMETLLHAALAYFTSWPHAYKLNFIFPGPDVNPHCSGQAHSNLLPYGYGIGRSVDAEPVAVEVGPDGSESIKGRLPKTSQK